MRQTFQRLIKMAAGYGLVQWAGPFISLVFTPIITGILVPSDYGIADYVLTVSSALGTVSAFAVPQALITHYNDSADRLWKQKLTGSAFLITLPIASIAAVALIFLGPAISQSTFSTSAYTHLFYIVGGTVLCHVCGTIFTTASQADLRVRWGMVFSMTTIVATIAGNVLFIVVLRMGVTGMILTPLVSSAAVLLMGYTLAHNLASRPSIPVAKLLLGSSVILLPTVLSYWSLQVADRLFLINYVTTTELGYYSIAVKIASLLGVVMAPLHGAWIPLALGTQNEVNAENQYTTLARFTMAIVLAGSLFLGLFATELLLILTRSIYLPAAPYVGILTYVHVFGALNAALNIKAMAGKHLKSMSASVAFGAIVNLILNIALIPTYGVWGAVIATVVGYAMPATFLYWRLRPIYTGFFPSRPIMIAMLLHLALMACIALLQESSSEIRVFMKVLIMAALPITFLLTNLVTATEIKQAYRWVWRRITAT